MFSGIQDIGLILICYLIGSIPFGVIISRAFFGFDIRSKGSGNMGSTNVFRVMGKKWGIAVQILDILKGVLPVLLVRYFYADNLSLELVAGIAAVIGHIFPIFSSFKGGKGINTLVGILLAISPIDILLALFVFLALFLSTGIVSLGSIFGAITISISLFLRNILSESGVEGFNTLFPFFIVISILVIITHRKNIKRLFAGRENRFDLPWLTKSKL
ncbi:MAG: glycerol-3-phosphate 1-O-acyltransferase PlsY [Candidatus Kapaibacteriales bacterium]